MRNSPGCSNSPGSQSSAETLCSNTHHKRKRQIAEGHLQSWEELCCPQLGGSKWGVRTASKIYQPAPRLLASFIQATDAQGTRKDGLGQGISACRFSDSSTREVTLTHLGTTFTRDQACSSSRARLGKTREHNGSGI